MFGLAKIASDENKKHEMGGYNPDGKIESKEHDPNRQFGDEVVEEWEPGNFFSRPWNNMKKRHLQEDLNMTGLDELMREHRQEATPLVGAATGMIGGEIAGAVASKDKPTRREKDEMIGTYGLAGMGLGAGAGYAAKKFIR